MYSPRRQAGLLHHFLQPPPAPLFPPITTQRNRFVQNHVLFPSQNRVAVSQEQKQTRHGKEKPLCNEHNSRLALCRHQPSKNSRRHLLNAKVITLKPELQGPQYEPESHFPSQPPVEKGGTWNEFPLGKLVGAGKTWPCQKALGCSGGKRMERMPAAATPSRSVPRAASPGASAAGTRARSEERQTLTGFLSCCLLAGTKGQS